MLGAVISPNGNYAEFDSRNADAIATLGIETGGGQRQLLYFGNLLVDVFAFCILADDFRDPLLVDDDGERNVVNLVAFAGGRGGMRTDFVVRCFLFSVLRALVLIFCCRRFVGNVLLDADVGLAGAIG